MPLTRSAAKREKESKALHSGLHRQDTLVTISTSATGQGTHTRWVRPPPAAEELESYHPSAPLPTTSSSSVDYVNMRFVTPAPRDSFDAGSVLRTPVKKKLAYSPDPIGPDRVDFWHDKDYEFKAFIADGGRSAVPHTRFQLGLQHPMTSKGQERGSRFGPEGTILNVEGLASPFQIGHGRPLQLEKTELLESHGTVLHASNCDSMNADGSVEAVSSVRRARLGPQGTEIIEA